MSDHDPAPDPIDKAYAEAEALMSDEAARAARRARVLEAVAREPAAPPAASSPLGRRPAWRRGGWLVAASVAALGLLVVTQVYRPFSVQPPTAGKSPAPARAAAPGVAAQGAPAAAAPSPTAAPPPTVAVAPTAPARSEIRAAAPSPAARPIAPPPEAFPAESAPAPPPPAAAQSVVVTAERRASAPAAHNAPRDDVRDEALASEAGVAEKASPPANAAPPAAAFSAGRLQSPTRAAPDLPARLRAAAAAGRTEEVKALLDQGVPVDAPDAEGDTALMRSIEADQPAAAALLRRRGANLDHKNHAGESARDIATAKGDAELNQALGLGP